MFSYCNMPNSLINAHLNRNLTLDIENPQHLYVSVCTVPATLPLPPIHPPIHLLTRPGHIITIVTHPVGPFGGILSLLCIFLRYVFLPHLRGYSLHKRLFYRSNAPKTGQPYSQGTGSVFWLPTFTSLTLLVLSVL